MLLEAWDPVARKRVGSLRSVRADVQGRFRVYGLAPGTYRIVSTLDVEDPDENEIATLYPQTMQVELGRDHQLDLDLAGIR